MATATTPLTVSRANLSLHIIHYAPLKIGGNKTTMKPQPPLLTGFLLSTLLGISAPLYGQTEASTPAALQEFGCQFHATNYYSKPVNSSLSQSSSHFLGLIEEADNLQSQLTQANISNENWSPEQAGVLLSLARTKLALGDNEGARELYENAMHNMRINSGIYALQQIPIILELMNAYMVVDSEFTDKLGDRAAFLFAKAYTEDRDLPKLIDGLSTILKLRLSTAGYTHIPSTVDPSLTSDTVFSQPSRPIPHLDKAWQIAETISALNNRINNLQEGPLKEQVLNEMGVVSLYGRTFYSAYDDLGNAIDYQNSGLAQVSSSTGAVLQQVQFYLEASGTEQAENLTLAGELLHQLHESFDLLTDIDRTALLDFYSDYFVRINDISAATEANERLLQIRVLRPDYQLRALRSLGQLYEHEERWRESIESYNCWRQLSTVEDERVFLGLSHGYQMLAEHELAIRHMLWYIELLDRDRRVADARYYRALRDMYYGANDPQAAAEIEQLLANQFSDSE